MTDNDYLKMIAERQEEHGDLLKEIHSGFHQHNVRLTILEHSDKERAAREEKSDANWAKAKMAAVTGAIGLGLTGAGTLIVNGIRAMTGK